MTENYNLNNIKTLLTKGFSEEELRDLCFFEIKFRPVYDLLPPNNGNKRKIVRLLIGYAVQKGLLNDLLAWAAQATPVIYEQYQPYFGAEEILEPVESQVIDVNFITAAMVQREAEALLNGKVFDDPAVAAEDREQFQEFTQALTQHDIQDWLTHYADSRDAWHPIFHAGASIKETVTDIVWRVNEASRNASGVLQIRPYFISEDFFSLDRGTRLRTWQSIDSGCIIVADSISLFHPGLRRMLLESGISAQTETALLILSPLNFDQLPINQLIEKQIMERVVGRVNNDLNGLSEFGSGDLRVTRRWLSATLPAVVKQRHQADPQNRQALRERLGKQPRGLTPLNF